VDDGGTEDADDTAGGTADDGEDDGLGDIEPVPGGMRRLLRSEYVRSVRLMLGPEAEDAADPPPDTAQLGWDAIGNAILSLSGDPIEDYEQTATAVANAVIANPAVLAETVPCVTGGSQDASCYGDIATDLGRFAFRRPVTDQERDALVAIAEEARAWDSGNFLTGVKYELMAILQAPSFVYLTEVGEAEGSVRRLTGNELAARMSMFFLGRTPDLAFLDAAEAGELDDEAGIREWAETLVASSEARLATENFFDEYLRLRNLASHPKNAEIFPAFTETLASAMRQETLLVINDIVWQNDGDFREVFDADYTYINGELAALYGMPAPGGPGFVKVDWPAEQHRAGLLSQGSFLALQSGPLRNSPTKRGKFVQATLLCNEIPPPPPGVEADLPEPVPGQTLKETLAAHMEDPSCFSCHGATDPIGFAFEFFDGIGAYRTLDNGSPIDAAGEVEGVGEWIDAATLATVIAEHPNTTRCVIQNVIEGNLGFAVTPGIAPGIAELETAFSDSGYSLQTMMVELAVSPLFRYVGDPK
ncbi:MAG: DUF1592 domain-containing protein, partial [Nannocystaceae bacterium]|nr:DUF1592 domain-containing protein [Nannocystaceae bacterium]